MASRKPQEEEGASLDDRCGHHAMPTGLILQPTYQIRDERPVVQLFGRLDDGPPHAAARRAVLE